LISASVAAGLALAGHPEPVTAAAVELPGATVTTDHTVGVTTTAAADPGLTPSPSPVPVVHAPTAPQPVSTTQASRAGCTASYEITDTWPGGAQVLVTVHNAQSTRLSGWTVGWTMPAGTDIQDLWNGTLTRDRSAVTVTDAGWNALVEPNASTSFGLNQVIPAGNPGVPRLTCRAT
jgi:cellulase/cellobiase CelA1